MLARHEERPRARLLTTLVTLLVIAATTACSGMGGTKAAAKPVITPSQAASVVMKLQTKRVAAWAAEDLGALKTLDAQPQLSLDAGAIRMAQSENASISDAPYVSVIALVPKQTAYPAWFMAVARDSSGPALDLFDRQSLKQPWLLVAETGLNDPVAWKKARGGWAIPASLSADPSRALAAYWNQNTNGADESGVPVAPGNWTSGLASQVNAAIAGNGKKDWAQIAVFSSNGPLTEGLKLKDGSSLGFAWVTETLRTRDAYGGCFDQPDSTGFRWDPLVPNGNYLEVAVTYTRLEGMTVPATGPLANVSYETGTIAAGGTPCAT